MNSIQTLIDQANPGDTIIVPGSTYIVDAVNAPIMIKKPLTLDLRLATIQTAPNDVNNAVYFTIGIWAASNVTLLLGDVVGERNGHIGTSPTGFGHGVAISGGSTNVKLQYGRIRDCMGDGVLILDAFSVEVDRVARVNNRRQGLTATNPDGLYVHDGACTNNGGAAPGAGIDLEPDPGHIIKNVRIEREHFSGNAGAGVLINCPPAQRSNITIANCSFVGKPIDGTDGIVPWWAKLIGPWTGWWGYPRELFLA